MTAGDSESNQVDYLISEGEALAANGHLVGMKRFVSNIEFADWQTRVLVFLDDYTKVHKQTRYLEQFQATVKSNTVVDVERGVGVLKAVQRANMAD